MTNNASSLYVHIPFCEHICTYCDFCKTFYDKKVCDKYIDFLIKELNCLPKKKFHTIYIGGGSPSSLNNNQLEKLLANLSNYAHKLCEFSIEVNPENIDENKMILFKKYNINRVSIGIQSFNEKIINILGRNHSYKEVENCVNLLNKYSIYNYSFDFIYGVRGQTIEMINSDIEKAIFLNPKHLSFYSLILEDHTMLKINKYKEISDDEMREQYDFIFNVLKENNYIRYEVSNFALKGYECKHNLVYWNNKEYYAIGVGASSYLNGIRYTTSRSLSKYLKGIIDKEENIADKEQEYIMLKLRLSNGIDLNEYQRIFSKNFLKEYDKVLKELIDKKLLIIKKDCLKTTYEGMMLLDTILIELMFSNEDVL